MFVLLQQQLYRAEVHLFPPSQGQRSVWSTQTSQTNQTLGVKRAWAQHRLPSVSAPSEWGKADRGQTHQGSPQAAQFQQGTLRISKSSETSTKKKQQDKSPKTNHNQGYRNRGENYLGGQENHTGYKRGEFETCHGALGRTAK